MSDQSEKAKEIAKRLYEGTWETPYRTVHENVKLRLEQAILVELLGGKPAKSGFRKPTPEQLDNRYTHHAPQGDRVIEAYKKVREAIRAAAGICVDTSPCSSEQSLALNALDQAMFLFNAAIARNQEAS